LFPRALHQNPRPSPRRGCPEFPEGGIRRCEQACHRHFTDGTISPQPNAYFLAIKTKLDGTALARYVQDGDKFKLMPQKPCHPGQFAALN